MIGTQKHIIRKVFVDVEAKSEGAAFRLKDRIDVFLKEEVFPSLERYFESLENELQSQTIQISQLTLDVKSNSDHDFEELKEAIKKQLVKEFQEIIKTPKEGGENVVFLSSNQSKEQSLIYFLENGIPPWWNGAKNNDFLEEKIVAEVFESVNFIKIFREKLQIRNVQDRLINQFSDVQIQRALYNIFKNDEVKISILEDSIVEKIKEQTPAFRTLLWKKYINYFQEKEATVFLTELLQFLPSDFKKEDQITISESFLEIVELIALQFDEVLPKNKNFKEGKIQDIFYKKDVERGNENSQSKDAVNTDKKGKFLVEEKEKTTQRNVSNTVSKKLLEDVSFRSEKEKMDSGRETSFSMTNKKDKSVLKEQETSDSDKKTARKNVENHEENDDSIVEFKESFQKEVSPDREHETLHQNEPKEKETTVDDSFSSKKERIVESNEKVKSLQELDGASIQSDEVSAETKKEVTFSKEEKTVQSEKSKPKSKQKEKVKSKNDAQTKDEIEFKRDLEIEKEFGLEEKNQIDSISKSKENPLEELVKSPIQPEEKGEYYIENAGLILLHPYLKDFFINCNLLNDENKMTNPELAIHLLHYIATKQEKQFESNMIFEKFLCGIPIHKSIRREVIISNELKQQSEDFLKAVISNWKALNNASPDLLRNEFLQRSGKISFKDVNPRIVVERKVHDILLDKIPWTISICKLPWVNKLIFTDW